MNKTQPLLHGLCSRRVYNFEEGENPLTVSVGWKLAEVKKDQKVRLVKERADSPQTLTDRKFSKTVTLHLL